MHLFLFVWLQYISGLIAFLVYFAVLHVPLRLSFFAFVLRVILPQGLQIPFPMELSFLIILILHNIGFYFLLILGLFPLTILLVMFLLDLYLLPILLI